MSKIIMSHKLTPDTEEKVKAIAVCLIEPGACIDIEVSAISTIEQELNNFLNVIKWIGVDFDFYNVSGIGNVINFINGSKIIFT